MLKNRHDPKETPQQTHGCTQPPDSARKYSSALCLLIGLWLALFAPLNSQQGAQAQSSQYEWSTPVKIDERQEPVSEMTLAADQSGLVHLFWNPVGTSEIYYSVLDGQAWSYPTDIISTPWARAPSAAVDAQGYIHLIWNDSLEVNYSQATVEAAGLASAWTEPVALAGSFTHAQIAVDPKGALVIAYPNLGSTGPAIITSEDGGVSWSDPMSVSPTSRSDAAADFVRAAVSADGTIHVVWSEYQLPNSYPPLGVYYSHSTNGGKNWSRAIKFAGENYHQANIITFESNTIHVAWNGAVPIGGRYYQVSNDGGDNWSNIYTIFAPGQAFSDGGPQLAVDSSGILHLATTYDQRIWHASFNGNFWTQPTYIASGDEANIPPLSQPIDPNTIRFIERVVMTTNLGNKLHIVFWDARPLGGPVSYWYTTKETDAAPVLPTPFPTVVSPATPTVLAIKPDIEPTALPKRMIEEAGPAIGSTSMNPALPVFIGLFPTILIIGGAVLVYFLKAKK